MVAIADEAIAEVDLDAAREKVEVRVREERRNVVAYLAWTPVVISACLLLSWLGMDEPGAVKAWEAALVILGGSGVVCLVILCWWRWYRGRAVRVLAGSDDGLGRWWYADARSNRREAVLNALCTFLLLSGLIIYVATALAGGAGVRSVAFEIAVAVVLFIAVIQLLNQLRSR